MPGKFKIVVSDLHLGAGFEAKGNALEDFGSDAEFVALLAELVAESEREGKEVELIVNGDAFEMLQVPNHEDFDPEKVYAPEAYHSSSEEDSSLKMALIVDGHRPFFDALRDFVQDGPPRRHVTFIKGNHDVNLHWTAVQNRIRQAMDATGERADLLTFEERRISREGIYVEHGNQYAEVVDRVKDMEEPHDHDEPDQLALPFGSWFVMDVFNEVERERYWIDGVKPITALIWFALKYDFAFAARAIATLLRRLPGIVQEGLFDVEESRAEALARQLEDPAAVDGLRERYEADDAFRAEFNAEVASLLAPPPELPGADAAPLVGVANPIVMGEQVQARVRSSLFEIASKRAIEEDVKLVTFGHTHEPGIEDLPGGGVYINSGTWTWRGDFTGAGKEDWQDLFEHPERFTGDRELHYVRIDYDEAGQPQGQLLVFDPESRPPTPTPPPSPTPSLSLWDRFLAWLRGLWARLVG